MKLTIVVNSFTRINSYFLALKRYVSSVNGTITFIQNNQVKGWAYQIGSKQQVFVRLYVNGKYISRQIASLPLQNPMLHKLKGDGNCGFQFELPFALKAGDKVDVKAGFIRCSLRNSPKFVPVFNDHSQLLEFFCDKEYDTPKVFFLHIPKTAGTSFSKILDLKFDASIQQPSKEVLIRNMGYPHTAYPFDLSIQQLEKCELLFGHYSFVIRNLLGKNNQVLTFLRKPLSRTISNLYQIKQKEKRYRDTSLYDIYCIFKKPMCNTQVRYLCNDDIFSNYHKDRNREMNEIDLTNAKQNLQKCFFVGITEYFEESIQLLEKKWDRELKHHSKKNVTRNKEDIEVRLIEEIKENNKLDEQLYEYALSIFIKICNHNNIKLALNDIF